MGKRKFPVIAGLLLLLVIAAVIGNQAGYFAVLGTNFATISLQQIQYTTNTDPSIQGANLWTFVGVLNGKGETPIAGFKLDSTTLASGDTKSREPIKIVTTIDKQMCTYTISKTASQLYDLSVAKQDFGLDILKAQEFKRACMADPNYFAWAQYPWSQIHFCITQLPSFTIGTIGAPDVDWQATIVLDAGSAGIKSKQLTDSSGPVSFDGVATVQTVGSMSADTVGCPSTADYRALFGASKWILTDLSLVEQTRAEYNSLLTASCKNMRGGGAIVSTVDVDQCVNAINHYKYSLYEPAVVYKPLVDIPTGSKTVTPGSIIDGKVIVDLSRLTAYPVLTFKISADWVKIFVPQAQPEIVSISVPKLPGSLQVAGTAIIKNLGPADLGHFTGSINCQAPVSGTGANIEVVKGATSQLYMSLLAASEYAGCRTCTLTVSDQNPLPGSVMKTVSKDFEVCYDATTFCTPGVRSCGADGNIHQCSAEGSGDPIVSACPNGCTFDADGPMCAATSCAAGQKWCASSKSCIANDAVCGGGSGETKCISYIQDLKVDGTCAFNNTAWVVVAGVVGLLGVLLWPSKPNGDVLSRIGLGGL